MHGMNRRCRDPFGLRAQFDEDGGRGPGRERGRHGGRGHGMHGPGSGRFGRGHGGDGGFGEEPRGFGGGRRRGKRFQGDELRLMVLALLEEGPRHGYELIRAFAERSGDAYAPSPGVLYPLLTLLEDMELIAEVPQQGSSRRSFALTDAGKAEVDGGRERIEALFARLASMAEATARSDAAPVRRAMMNLRTATMQRLTRDRAATADAPDPLAFDIAAILDEAAQKIERL